MSAGSFELRFDPQADDPHPVGDEAHRSTWGDLRIRVNGRLLTRFERGGETFDAVRWYVGPLARWLRDNLLPVFHESLPPRLIDDVESAAAWFAASDRTPNLTEKEEEAWFEDRRDWWGRHAIRAGADGAVLPNLLLRRVGPYLECSWDNVRFPAPRKDLFLLDREGVEFVPVEEAARGVRLFLDRVLRSEASSSDTDWIRWAIPHHVREGLGEDVGLIRRQCAHPDYPFLDRPDAKLQVLAAVPPGVSESTIRKIADLISDQPGARTGSALQDLREPSALTVVEPWDQGYRVALSTRRRLRLGDGPIGDLPALLRERLGLRTCRLDIEPHVEGLRSWRAGGPMLIATNLHARLGRGSFAVAREFAHLVLDQDVDAAIGGVSSAWESWALSARAKAFAAMLLMPETALRDRGDLAALDPAGLSALSSEFGITPRTAAWHLKNLQFISETKRVELLESGALHGIFPA